MPTPVGKVQKKPTATAQPSSSSSTRQKKPATARVRLHRKQPRANPVVVHNDDIDHEKRTHQLAEYMYAEYTDHEGAPTDDTDVPIMDNLPVAPFFPAAPASSTSGDMWLMIMKACLTWRRSHMHMSHCSQQSMNDPPTMMRSRTHPVRIRVLRVTMLGRNSASTNHFVLN